MILTWYEHLPEADMPPKWMWPLGDHLEDHFKKLKRRRENGDEDDEPMSGPVVKNDYARQRGSNMR